VGIVKKLQHHITTNNTLPTKNKVSIASYSAKDIIHMINDFMQKQQALQLIKTTPSF